MKLNLASIAPISRTDSNTIEAARYIEDVAGEIIGDYMRRVELYNPRGNLERRAELGYDESPKDWGEKVKAELLARPCGDGQPMSFHPSLVESCYGKGTWEIRIYN